MKTKSYNLLDEAWIQVLNKDNHWESVGIKYLFKHAHELIDIRVKNFNGINFPIYESLLLRFLSAICSDAFASYSEENLYEDKDKINLLKKEKFDVDSNSKLGKYFDENRDRFDLFSDTPFLQLSASDIEEAKKRKLKISSSEENIIIINPTAIAASGRMFGSGLDQNKLLKYYCEDNDALFGTVNSLFTFNKESYKYAINEYYKLSCEHLAYILLYVHTCAPKVRMKGSFLNGVGYFQYMKGKNLKTTIVLNSQLINDENQWNVPMWRWEKGYFEGLDRLCNSKSQDNGILSELFFPSRIVKANQSEDGFIREMICSTIIPNKKIGELYSEMQKEHISLKEPYLVKKYIPKYKKNEINLEEENILVSAKTFEPAWVRLLSSSCGLTKDYIEENIKSLEGAYKISIHSEQYLEIAKKGAITEYGIRACIYYIYEGEHSKIKITGKIEGDISENILNSYEKSIALEKMFGFVKTSVEKIDYYEKKYMLGLDAKSTNNDKKIRYNPILGKQLANEIEILFGLTTGNKDGYFYKLSDLSEEEINKLILQFKKEVISKVSELFESIKNTNKLIEFYENKFALIRNLNNYLGKGSEN